MRIFDHIEFAILICVESFLGWKIFIFNFKLFLFALAFISSYVDQDALLATMTLNDTLALFAAFYLINFTLLPRFLTETLLLFLSLLSYRLKNQKKFRWQFIHNWLCEPLTNKSASTKGFQDEPLPFLLCVYTTSGASWLCVESAYILMNARGKDADWKKITPLS